MSLIGNKGRRQNMATTPCLLEMGRSVVILAIIIQAIIFSAHMVEEHEDRRYYASTLIASVTLVANWWYINRALPERIGHPTFVFPVYALSVVSFQGLSLGTTDTLLQDATLFYIANVFTPVTFLLCIVTGCEQCLKDADFTIASGVAIFDAFDATDAIISIAQTESDVPVGFRTGFVAMASLILLFSALKFTVRTQVKSGGVISRALAPVLDATHMVLNAVLLGMRVVMYANGMIKFSVMIAKNCILFFGSFVYMLASWRVPSRVPQHLSALPVPSAPPPPTKDCSCLTRPPTPLPVRSNLQDEAHLSGSQPGIVLYPVLPRQVHFAD